MGDIIFCSPLNECIFGEIKGMIIGIDFNFCFVLHQLRGKLAYGLSLQIGNICKFIQNFF